MPGLLYYIPKTKSATRKAVESGGIVHLHDCFHSCGIVRGAHRQVHNNGPDGGDGLIFAPDPAANSGGSAASKVGFWRDVQRWQKTPSGYWVGVNKADTVRPRDLQRPTPSGGWREELADGNEWTIARGRALVDDAPGGLPSALRMNADGELESEVLAPFRSAAEDAERAYLHCIRESDEDDNALSREDEFRICATALGVNYRICVGGISLLGLFTEDAIRRILEAFTDIRLMREVSAANEQKKSAEIQDSSDSSHGQTD